MFDMHTNTNPGLSTPVASRVVTSVNEQIHANFKGCYRRGYWGDDYVDGPLSWLQCRVLWRREMADRRLQYIRGNFMPKGRVLWGQAIPESRFWLSTICHKRVWDLCAALQLINVNVKGGRPGRLFTCAVAGEHADAANLLLENSECVREIRARGLELYPEG